MCDGKNVEATEFRCFPLEDVRVLVVPAAELVFMDNGEMCLLMTLHAYGENQNFGMLVCSLQQAASGCGMGNFHIHKESSCQASGWEFSFKFRASLVSRKRGSRWLKVQSLEETEWCFTGKVGHMGLLVEHLEGFIPEKPTEPNFGA
jgi:hypothetical protein